MIKNLIALFFDYDTLNLDFLELIKEKCGMERMLTLFGEITHESTQRYLEDFHEALAELKRGEIIITLIDSPGGAAFGAQTLLNVISCYHKKTMGIVTGYAASGALLVLQAFGQRKAFDNAFLQFHNPILEEGAKVNAEDSQESAEFLKKLREVDVAIFAKRTGQSPLVISQFILGNRLFSAADALRNGLIDEVIEPVIIDSVKNGKRPSPKRARRKAK